MTGAEVELEKDGAQVVGDLSDNLQLDGDPAWLHSMIQGILHCHNKSYEGPELFLPI